MLSDFSHVGLLLPDSYRVLLKESVGSSNDEARILAEQGAAHGLIVLAENQSAGRGRRGAAWLSEAGKALTFTVIIRPSASKEKWCRLALATGLAIADTMNHFGAHAKVKWPNDVWVDDRKIAGVLTETGADFAIIGIGLNVLTECFADDLGKSATSLLLATGRSYERAKVLAALIKCLDVRVSQIDSEFCHLMADLRANCALTGRLVTLKRDGIQATGMIEGINEEGLLIFQNENEKALILQADEIRPL